METKTRETISSPDPSPTPHGQELASPLPLPKTSASPPQRAEQVSAHGAHGVQLRARLQEETYREHEPARTPEVCVHLGKALENGAFGADSSKCLETQTKEKQANYCVQRKQ